MRRVVSSKEVYHLWAHQTQDEARNSSHSVSFTGACAYSYRATIAKRVELPGRAGVVLFSSHKWSVTTAKHQRMCRASIPEGWQVFTVPSIGHSDDAANDLTNLKYYAQQVAEYQGKAKRARTYGPRYAERALELQQEANAYCRYFGIADAFDADTLRVAVEAHEVERTRLEAEALESQRVAREALRVEYADAARGWINSEPSARLPWNYPDVLLRVDTFGGEVPSVWQVETSMGARVPLPDAEALYRKIKAGALAKGDSAGGYTVSRVEAQAVQIGCHYIALTEIERFATTQGWNATPSQA